MKYGTKGRHYSRIIVCSRVSVEIWHHTATINRCKNCFYMSAPRCSSIDTTAAILLALRTKSRGRMLRLEVIWSTVSREEAREFLLPRGSIVERNQDRLSQFETFRALWAQDERRKSVREEWALLSGVL